MANKIPLIKRTSRLKFGIYLQDTDFDQEGFDFYDLLDLPVLISQSDDIKYIVKSTDRIDLLAYRFYGDPVLWWVIAVANAMELLPSDLIEGEEILIPSPRYVRNDLFKTPIVRS